MTKDLYSHTKPVERHSDDPGTLTDAQRDRQAIIADVGMLCRRITDYPEADMATADYRHIRTRLERVVRDFRLSGGA